MRAWIIAAGIALMAPSAAVAQEGPLLLRLRECTGITVRLERLRCFDAFAARVLALSPEALDSASVSLDLRASGTGDWVVDESINPLDDSRLVILSIKARTGAAKSGDPVELVLRCMSGKTDVYINWNEQLGRDGATVTTRIGGAAAASRRWGVSTDARETFYPGDDIDFIQQLIAVDRLVAQVVPPGEDPITAVFRLRGLEYAVPSLRQVCEW